MQVKLGKNKGQKQQCIKYIFSAYNFHVPLYDRLINPEWKQALSDNQIGRPMITLPSITTITFLYKDKNLLRQNRQGH